MRVLPILWDEKPTQEDWARLSQARKLIDWDEKIMPAKALEGSPGPILCVMSTPDWLTDFAWVASTEDVEVLADALRYCLEGGNSDHAAQRYIEQLSEWFGGEVKYLGEEEYPGSADG